MKHWRETKEIVERVVALLFVQAATEAPTLEAVREMQTRLAKKSPFAVSTIVEGSDAGHAIVLPRG